MARNKPLSIGQERSLEGLRGIENELLELSGALGPFIWTQSGPQYREPNFGTHGPMGTQRPRGTPRRWEAPMGVGGPLGAPRGRQGPLGRQGGLPAWSPGPAWASVLPVLAFRTPVGHQLDAK